MCDRYAVFIAAQRRRDLGDDPPEPMTPARS
jgi:hypothetical protein